jgi:hypothetical protein
METLNKLTPKAGSAYKQRWSVTGKNIISISLLKVSEIRGEDTIAANCGNHIPDKTTE